MIAFLPVLLLGASAAAAPLSAGAFVLNRPVEAGDILADADFTPQSDVAASNSLSPRQAAGREATHHLSQGAVVRPTDVRAPQQVKRGDSILIAIRSGPLLITTQGRALTGGGVGDPVRVTSDSTRRTLQAVVEGPRRVKILTE